MRTPISPPSTDQLLTELVQHDATAVLGLLRNLPTDRRYLHWDKLHRMPPPDGLTHREWWLGLKLTRRFQPPLPLVDVKNRPFIYSTPDPVLERLHDIDMRAGGAIGIPDPVVNPDLKDRYLIHSLMDEAITSSQLEGAATTRQVAKEMIRTGRRPRDRSEQMIFNNYVTMQEIVKLRKDPLIPERVIDLHHRVTEGTLGRPGDAGRFRRSDERIDVGDDSGRVFHHPPPAEQLEIRMQAMCDFANRKTPDHFVHPVLRAIILHFWLAYDHPFVDGNGRTARALFYWAMLHYGYWLCEFFSISEIIRKAPARYGTAFLYTETDENDLTYFVLYHLDVIHRALNQLHEYVERKTLELQNLERRMRALALLNHRQQALISHALRHPHFRYTIEGHRRSHNVVYETARTDLLDLVQRGLLAGRKVRKEWQFTPEDDLEQKLLQS